MEDDDLPTGSMETKKEGTAWAQIILCFTLLLLLLLLLEKVRKSYVANSLILNS